MSDSAGSPAILPFPRVITHRCGGTLTPENTLVGIQKSLEFEIPAIEFDAMLSADKIPMLMHDDELTRTVHNPNYAGKLMNAYTCSELKKLDVGSYFSDKYSDVFIPTLEEVMVTCIEKRVFMNIEIKPAKGHEMRTGIVVAETVLKYHEQLLAADVMPILSSFSFDALKAAKEVAPNVARGFLVDGPLDELQDWQAKAQELDVVSMHCDADHLTKLNVDEIKALGYAILCYTVNDLDQANRLLDWGVSSLCTDKADTFADLAKKLRETTATTSTSKLTDTSSPSKKRGVAEVELELEGDLTSLESDMSVTSIGSDSGSVC
eukprot:CAMPEP_0174972482 /NCGR_PEP_ID=MMETSP0004_2-20121128/10656_1 /TAXON_ID=420556 /ORGANISM="Ochromonas sp., Strain CCMP1393" /LENGTH=320 /DNA_ID=CAMNT_0016222715 /DNA_START=96 /DNA_END=1058 /DNA_ORIENTATION=-